MITLLKANNIKKLTSLLSTAEFLDQADMASIQNAFLNQSSDERWVGYEISGNLSGVAYVSKTEGYEKKWAIKFLFVRPDMRGMGVSKTLVKYIEMELEKWDKVNLPKEHKTTRIVRDYYEFFNRWGYIYL